MKIPEEPPPFDELMRELSDRPDRMTLLTRAGRSLAAQSTYLHWDDLRYREPPTGLTRRQWWAQLKLQRIASAHSTGVPDKHGEAFWFVKTPAMDRMLHRIDQALAGGIEVPGRSDVASAGDRYLVSSMMEEAINSSQLEGASTTRRVAKEMLRGGRAPRNPDEQMIWNNYQAIEFVRQHLDDELDLTAVLEIHRLVTEGTLEEPDLAGHLRLTDDIQVIYRPEGRVLHQPPPAAELQQRLRALFSFAAADPDEGPWVHPVVRAIVAHFLLAYDHPFVDGNGRVARIMFYATMLKRGYWLAAYLSVSRIIKKGPEKYARAFLLTEHDDGDLTYFILYHLDVIVRAIDELHAFIQRSSERGGRARMLARSLPDVNARQVTLLDHAARHPDASYEIAVHQGYHRISYPTARQDLLQLADRGFLEKKKLGRKLLFFVPSDLDSRLRSG